MYQPSTPPVVTPHVGRTALFYGASTGIGMGILQSVLVFVMLHGYSPLSILIIPFSLLLWIILFLLSGAFAGRRIGKIGAGTLAGLWTGLVGGIITAISVFVAVLPSIYSPYYGYYPSGFSASAAFALTSLIILILAMLGVGTGLGALGGLIGQSFSSARYNIPPHYQQSDLPLHDRARYQQSDPPAQEQEMVQYQRSNPLQEG